MVGNHIIKSWSTNQAAHALSSGEAEYYSLGKLAAHLLFYVYIFKEIGMKVKAVAYSDSAAARGITSRTGPGRVRHLQTRFLWLQERVRERDLAFVGVGISRTDVGDVCTSSHGLAGGDVSRVPSSHASCCSGLR